jgi:hypothetical protein
MNPIGIEIILTILFCKSNVSYREGSEAKRAY